MFYFSYLKKNTKESRNRDKERKIQRKGSKFLMKGVHFWKKLSMTKTRSSEIFENRRVFLKISFRMLSENIFSLNFCPPDICDSNVCPPIFMTSLRRWIVGPIFASGEPRATTHSLL